jgi:hypothetical protein
MKGAHARESLVLQGVTEDYEQQLWEELNKLLADAIPAETSGDDAVNAMVALVNGADTEIAELYAQVRTIAWEQCEGYLWERLREDNPIAAVKRRLSIHLRPAR